MMTKLRMSLQSWGGGVAIGDARKCKVGAEPQQSACRRICNTSIVLVNVIVLIKGLGKSSLWANWDCAPPPHKQFHLVRTRVVA